MGRDRLYTFRKIDRLRALYERHCFLLGIPKYNLDRAEYNGVLLGIDLVLEVDKSIKDFEDDIRRLEGLSKEDRVNIPKGPKERTRRQKEN
jgi:hypothetical protein